MLIFREPDLEKDNIAALVHYHLHISCTVLQESCAGLWGARPREGQHCSPHTLSLSQASTPAPCPPGLCQAGQLRQPTLWQEQQAGIAALGRGRQHPAHKCSQGEQMSP